MHLTNWPKTIFSADKKIIEDMDLVRRITEIGHRSRKELKIKTRQILSKLVLSMPKNSYFLEKNYLEDYLTLISDELNVKKIEIVENKTKSIKVDFETKLTQELVDEGLARELVRTIQQERKKSGFKVTQKIDVTLPDFPKRFEGYIKQKVLAVSLSRGPRFEINPAYDEEA